jgi:hypothetical protein
MRRHPLDPVSLVAGLLFAGISISLLTGRLTAGARHLNLVWAVGAVLVGLALLASGRRSGDHVPLPASTAVTGEEIGED